MTSFNEIYRCCRWYPLNFTDVGITHRSQSILSSLSDRRYNRNDSSWCTYCVCTRNIRRLTKRYLYQGSRAEATLLYYSLIIRLIAPRARGCVSVSKPLPALIFALEHHKLMLDEAKLSMDFDCGRARESNDLMASVDPSSSCGIHWSDQRRVLRDTHLLREREASACVFFIIPHIFVVASCMRIPRIIRRKLWTKGLWCDCVALIMTYGKSFPSRCKILAGLRTAPRGRNGSSERWPLAETHYLPPSNDGIYDLKGCLDTTMRLERP